MKRYLLILGLLVCQTNYASWIYSLEEAQKFALATNKLIIIDFYADWCKPCKKMDQQSWSNEEVRSITENFVLAKINIDTNSDIALRYNIKSIPSMFVIDANEKIIHSFSGYKDANQLKRAIETYALSTEYLAIDMIHYFKARNYNTSLRLFQKYLDYSLLVDIKIKNQILNVAEDYFNDAKKDTDKKAEGYQEKKQKLALFDVFIDLYEFKFDSIKKKLETINELELTEENKNIFYFLQFITASYFKNDDLEEIKAKTTQLDGFEYFMDKANFILSKK